MVDDLRWQEVELDVGMGDVWATSDETSALQVGCCSITYMTSITARRWYTVMYVNQDNATLFASVDL